MSNDLEKQRIVFQEAGAPVAVMLPCRCGLTITEIGSKDVPDGVPFWIISVDDVPSDRTLRGAWALDVGAMGKPSGVGEAK